MNFYQTLFFLFIKAFLLTSSLGQLRNIKSLNNTKLFCCAMLQYPNVYTNPLTKGGLDGMAIYYLDALQKELDFKCETLEVLKGVGFTEMIIEMNRCSNNDPKANQNVCKCELGVGGWMLTQARLGKVTYLPPFVRDDIRVLTHADNTYFGSRKTPFFVSGFTGSVWASIAGLLVLWSIMKVLDVRFVPNEKPFKPLSRDASWPLRMKHCILKTTIARRFRKSLQSTAGRLIGHADESVEHGKASSRHWFLNFIILLCGLVFLVIYEATMTANLVQESRQSDFHSVDDFRQCIIPPEQVCVPSGGATNGFWNSLSEGQKCHEGREAQITEGYDAAIDRLANKECTYLLIDGSTAHFATNVKYCRKIVNTGDPVFPSTNSFVLPRNSGIYFPLANMTLQLLEQRKLISVEEFFELRGDCVIPESTLISFNKMQLFFILAYASTGVILIVMLFDPQQLEPLGAEEDIEIANGEDGEKENKREEAEKGKETRMIGNPQDGECTEKVRKDGDIISECSYPASTA